MADLQTLNIVIGANTQAATAGLNAVSKSLANTAVAAQKVDSSIAKSTTNFTGLSRVIQDLPFGFVAISNNLEQIISSAVPLGLVFSALIATITFLQIGFRNWLPHIKKDQEAIDEFTKSLRGAEQGAVATGVKLQSFVNIAKDSTKSFEERNNALREANNILGDHAKKLTLVSVNTKEATDEVNKFTESLINQALASKYADRVADLLIKQKDASKAYGESLKESNKQAKEADELNKLSVSGGSGGVGGLGNVSAINKARSAYNDAVKSASAYKDVTKELHDVYGEFTSLQIKGLTDIIPPKPKKPIKVSDFFAVDTNIKDIPKKFIDAIAIDTGDHINQTINKALDKGPGIVVKPKVDFDVLEYQINNISDILGQTLKPAIDSVFAAFANGQNAFDALGQAIKSIIAKLAAAVLEAAIFSLIINAITGGVASFAGFGKILSALSGLPKFAAGGVVTRPTLLIAGEQGPERITPLNQINNGGNAMIGGEFQLRVRGQDLWAVLNRYNKTAYNTF